MIESGGEIVCKWFALTRSLLPHPHTLPTAAALLIPQNPLTSENRNDNAANYPGGRYQTRGIVQMTRCSMRTLSESRVHVGAD